MVIFIMICMIFFIISVIVSLFMKKCGSENSFAQSLLPGSLDTNSSLLMETWEKRGKKICEQVE